MQNKTEEEINKLEDVLARLAAGTLHHPDGMGETYKFMAITQHDVKTLFPFCIDFSSL
jgi:hypothetical protein